LLYKMRRLGISRPVIDESLSAGWHRIASSSAFVAVPLPANLI